MNETSKNKLTGKIMVHSQSNEPFWFIGCEITVYTDGNFIIRILDGVFKDVVFEHSSSLIQFLPEDFIQFYQMNQYVSDANLNTSIFYNKILPMAFFDMLDQDTIDGFDNMHSNWKSWPGGKNYDPFSPEKVFTVESLISRGIKIYPEFYIGHIFKEMYFSYTVYIIPDNYELAMKMFHLSKFNGLLQLPGEYARVSFNPYGYQMYEIRILDGEFRGYNIIVTKINFIIPDISDHKILIAEKKLYWVISNFAMKSAITPIKLPAYIVVR